jgi:hypothetical protein
MTLVLRQPTRTVTHEGEELFALPTALAAYLVPSDGQFGEERLTRIRLGLLRLKHRSGPGGRRQERCGWENNLHHVQADHRDEEPQHPGEPRRREAVHENIFPDAHRCVYPPPWLLVVLSG